MDEITRRRASWLAKSSGNDRAHAFIVVPELFRSGPYIRYEYDVTFLHDFVSLGEPRKLADTMPDLVTTGLTLVVSDPERFSDDEDMGINPIATYLAGRAIRGTAYIVGQRRYEMEFFGFDRTRAVVAIDGLNRLYTGLAADAAHAARTENEEHDNEYYERRYGRIEPYGRS